MTDDFDHSNPRHKEIQHGIELGNGIPEMRPIHQARDALKAVGFKIEHEEDLAARPDKVEWWYSISGDMSKVQSLWDYPLVWRMTKFGRNLTGYGVWALEKAHLIPKGTYDVQEALKVAGQPRAVVAELQELLSDPFACSRSRLARRRCQGEPLHADDAVCRAQAGVLLSRLDLRISASSIDSVFPPASAYALSLLLASPARMPLP